MAHHDHPVVALADAAAEAAGVAPDHLRVVAAGCPVVSLEHAAAVEAFLPRPGQGGILHPVVVGGAGVQVFAVARALAVAHAATAVGEVVGPVLGAAGDLRRPLQGPDADIRAHPVVLAQQGFHLGRG